MSTHERLQALLEADFDVPREKLAREALLEDLDIDSLRMIEIVFRVEEIFGISVPAEQAELRTRLKTFGDLADYVESLVEAGGERRES
jgi:acyl carrier protein